LDAVTSIMKSKQYPQNAIEYFK